MSMLSRIDETVMVIYCRDLSVMYVFQVELTHIPSLARNSALNG